MIRYAKTTLAALGLSSIAAGAALAGSLQDPVVETPVAMPAPVAMDAGDWTGFYTGLQLGYADADGPGALDGSDNAYGFHAGYDHDFGRFVLGGELDYDKTNLDLGGGQGEIDSVARLKVKGGYDLGNTLVYATAGMARADTSLGDETGPFAGIGVTHKVSERYSIGAELLEHRFSDVGGVAGNDLDATTFSIRGSLRF